jgi:TfoX/Sxy family transcriptional regulator of competence genes
MATKQETAARILSALQGTNIRMAKMFGEYALYCDEKVVALIADDEFFLKITPASSAHFGSKDEAPPYPGAKAHYRVPESHWEKLTPLVNAVASELPAPKPKKKKM